MSGTHAGLAGSRVGSAARRPAAGRRSRSPSPGPGEVRVKVAAIPLNLNDLERITGGNMMVIPPLPCTPGMEVMGVVDACGEGTEALLGKRVVVDDQPGDRRLRGVRALRDRVDVRDARGHPAARRGRHLLPVPSRLARPLRARQAEGRRERAHPRRRRRRRVGRRAAGGERRRPRLRHRRLGGKARALPRTRRRRRHQLQGAGLRRGRARRDRQPRGRRGVRQRRRRHLRPDRQVHRVRRAPGDDGLRRRQDQGRRAVHRPAPGDGREHSARRRADVLRRTRRRPRSSSR